MKKTLLCITIVLLALFSCTPEEQPPVISYVFSDVSVDAGQTSATILCRNESVDDEKVHASVLLSKNENITDATKYPMRLQNDTLRSTINGLEQNTMYFFCFEIYTANEHKRTDEVHHFQTTGGSDSNITVTTSEAINITQTTATGGGSVVVNGNYTVSMRGVCWDTMPNPNALQSPHLISGQGTGSFLVNITGLKSNTQYYLKAYAVCNDVVYYGNEVSFITQIGQVPSVNTGEVTNITRTSALASGNVTDDGGLDVTERGVCWSTAHAPNIEGSHANNGTVTGAFSIEIGELVPNTTYYVRAYAQNAKGVAYGDEVEFKTAEDVSSPLVNTLPVTNITSTTATGGGNVTNDGGATVTGRGICWSTNHNPTINDEHATNGTGLGEFSVVMADLTPGTTYYVRAYAENSQGVSYGMEVGFVTVANPPTVTTGDVSNITQTTALGSGTVTDDGGLEITERGLCWSTSHNPTLNDSHASNGIGTGGFTVEMTGLTSNTTYYVRAYAINSQGTAYGNEKEFKTSQNVSAPTVTTSEVSNVTQTTAKGGGNVTNDGGANVTERGICWSTEHNPTISDSHTNSGTGTGEFNCNMSGLTAGTTYYVRAYAKNSQGTSYGAEVSFITEQQISLPTVTTAQVSNITQTTATGGGNVTATGNATVTERGICWSTSHNPTTSGSHASNGSGTGTYSVNMTGLTPNTTYYVRAYATNSAGTVYGAEVSFTTLQDVSLPTVTTSQVTMITQTTAIGGGNVTSAGGATVTERGICWSTSHNPTTSNTHANNGTGTGSYSINMTNLTANTTYYVRAYATNSAGTAYGAEVSFTTLQSVNPPTVTTSQVTNITQTTATGGGNVTATGGGNVTDRGICWSTSHNPTISGNHASGGTGAGSFTVNMTGLTANTTYYVRAYATNSAGTAYGTEVSFTTLHNITLPTVTTNQVTNITQTSATGGGNVTNDGYGTVTERGICWSTSHNPTTNSSHLSGGAGLGAFTVDMSGLTANTTYYVRAYAINSAGTAYGAEVNFTTSQIPTYMIGVSANPSNGGTATGGGTYQQGQNCTVSATANSGYSFANWTENGNVVSTNANYTFAVTTNRTLVANFIANPQNYTISVSANPSNGGSVSGGGTFQQGQSCTVTATAATGYTFLRWTENGNQVSTNASYTFTVNSNRTLVAQFQAQSYTISVSASPSNGGSVNGGGSYNYGQSCTVTATANSSYTFTNWTENGNVVSSNANYTFTVNGNRTLVANFTVQPQAPTGAINGLFSVSASQQVYFSQGNLQYNKTTQVWSFMEHQYDMVETYGGVGENYANQNIVSLFGWGTSGYNHGAVCYQPWSTSRTTSDYYAYGQDTYNLYDQDGHADWGYNAISNGGGQENSGWRTMTGGDNGEWNYIFNQRNASTVNGTANARYAKAKVNNVQGVILFPDTYTHPSVVAQPVGINDSGMTGWNGNNYSAEDFELMEQNGAVFLPAAGRRVGSLVDYVGSISVYWSSSKWNSNNACLLNFGSSGLSPNIFNSRDIGCSVRLVQDY